MQFSDLGLNENVLRAVTDAGYTEPTPIQEQGIPHILQGRDLLGVAQTGTGKTASFTLPLIDRLAAGRARARIARTLILEPTRELAAQVSENFEIYGKYHKLTMALLIGGVSFGDQEKKLDRGVDVLIATPGRLLDHFGRGKLMLTGVQILVIDEADRMLDMGFIPDVERICKLIAGERQTLLFSATMPAEIQKLADRFMTNPVQVEVAPPASPAALVEQRIAYLSSKDKESALRAILAAAEVKNAIIFCNRKRDVDSLFKSLKRQGHDVAALHGDMAQSIRMEVLSKFKAGGVEIMIASDVAARGLDIAAVSHVFNYDVPIHPEDYIHRIVRTGRAGRSGHAVTFATPAEKKYVDAIVNLLGKEIPKIDIPGIRAPAAESGETAKRPPRGRSHSSGQKKPTESKTSQPRKSSPAAEKPGKEIAASDATPGPSAPEATNETRKETKPKPKAPKASTARGSKDQEKPRAASRKRGGRETESSSQKGSSSGPVVGLGDHVPAFLQRAPKQSS